MNINRPKIIKYVEEIDTELMNVVIGFVQSRINQLVSFVISALSDKVIGMIKAKIAYSAWRQSDTGASFL